MNVADFSESTYNALKEDILAMFTDSKDFWPADFGEDSFTEARGS